MLVLGPQGPATAWSQQLCNVGLAAMNMRVHQSSVGPTVLRRRLLVSQLAKTVLEEAHQLQSTDDLVQLECLLDSRV